MKKKRKTTADQSAVVIIKKGVKKISYFMSLVISQASDEILFQLLAIYACQKNI